MSPVTPRLYLLGVGFALLGVGCSSSSIYGTGAQEPSSTETRTGYVASIRVESVVRGGGVKVNGFLASDLPGRVEVEVDETGKLTKPYVITLSTNILLGESARVTLEPGEAAPGRIFFDYNSTQQTEQAAVRKVK